MRFGQLVQKLGADHHSLIAQTDLDPEVIGVAAIDAASTGMLSYIEGAKFAAQIDTTAASVLILPQDVTLQSKATERGIAWIAARDSRLVFAQAIALFYQPFKLPPGIHSSAVIAPDAEVGDNVAIAAHVVIQSGAKIGANVCIHPNVVIYPQATVGDRTVLHANCVIHERTQIGADCVVHAGAVIGSEGFGFVPTAEGWYKMEQSGRTVLEDGVEVGCNTTIDRPSVGETRIGRNTKIDNLVQIGHGCQLDEACVMAAQGGLAGGVKLGKRVMLGGQVGVANQAKIGEGVQAAAQAGIHNDVKPGEIVIGAPAIPYRVFLKASAVFPKLPEMQKALRELQKRLGMNNQTD
ncbi:MAG: UDP-3-O-(3-hydroxymyristoyl)glucosamine N-acyltransferase [Scytolyngbya sp. HA4215-MV1]|nr:UDP-3-O-(3-hydroxymyristoyl)glucosamine N-acyltransferase [Scytolyngbya sp. HA4215-MV1]